MKRTKLQTIDQCSKRERINIKAVFLVNNFKYIRRSRTQHERGGEQRPSAVALINQEAAGRQRTGRQLIRHTEVSGGRITRSIDVDFTPLIDMK